MPLTPGTRLGPYEIVSLLGEGGMGAVYRARDSRLDREVAVGAVVDHRGNPIPVHRAGREHAEHEEIQRSLNQRESCSWHGLLPLDGVGKRLVPLPADVKSEVAEGEGFEPPDLSGNA